MYQTHVDYERKESTFIFVSIYIIIIVKAVLTLSLERENASG